MRRSGRTRILLTGATGFLGIHLAEMLARKGYFIYLLVRPQNGIPPEERICELFDWMSAGYPDKSSIHIVPGDLNRSDLGLDRADYYRLSSEVDEIIHCASETSFSERKRARIEKANVENLYYLLDFAVKGGCCFFVDFFVAAFSAIMETATDGGVFHITNERAKPVADLIDYIQRYFKIKGIQAVPPESFPSGDRNRLETLFNRYVEAYKPYMKDERIFDNRNAAVILNKYGISCPDFDYSIFSTCMQYAESVNWGNSSL